jgi:hypothetical protein
MNDGVKIYKYDGNDWSVFSESPSYIDFHSSSYTRDSLIVYNGNLHMISQKLTSSTTANLIHYIWDYDNWIEVNDTPTIIIEHETFPTYSLGVSNYNNMLYILYASESSGTNKMYAWQATT